MERFNLKQVKECLDKIPIEELEKCYVMHPFSSETPDNEEISLLYFDDNFAEFFEKYNTEIISKFIKQVLADQKIVEKCVEDGHWEDYNDDVPV